MDVIKDLKERFSAVVKDKGYITEQDFIDLCQKSPDVATTNKIAHWLLATGVPLRKSIGPQYRQEIKRRVNNPNVKDVVDTKNRTHVNPNKFQQSKKDVQDCGEKEASFHLNKVIEELKEPNTKDEFMPAWKDVQKKKNHPLKLTKQSKVAGYKLARFLQENPDVISLLGKFGLDAAIDWGFLYTTEAMQGYIMNTITKLGDKIYLDPVEYPEVSGVNLGNVSDAGKAISSVRDITRLRDISMALDSGNYSTVPLTGQPQDPTAWKQPSSVEREIDFGDTGDSEPLELASHLASKKIGVRFTNGSSFVAAIADTPEKKAAGLEVYNSLTENEGLYFPFEEPSSVTFHMGKVKFPIDIIFLGEGPHGLEISKIVKDAKPGALDYWSHNKTKAVLELAGGVSDSNKLYVGLACSIIENKIPERELPCA